ncbi:MAG: DUF1653 domain-containing protein [Patescibacteria group bacterium]
MEKIKLGIYEHFKGNRYKVLGVAKNSEASEQEFVVYQALYGEHDLWIRPLAMFLETVDKPEYKGPRFKYVGE